MNENARPMQQGVHRSGSTAQTVAEVVVEASPPLDLVASGSSFRGSVALNMLDVPGLGLSVTFGACPNHPPSKGNKPSPSIEDSPALRLESTQRC